MNAGIAQIKTDLQRKPSKEPAVDIGIYTTGILGFLYFMSLVFPDFFPKEVTDAILGILGITAPAFASLLIRRKVWSPATVLQLIKEMEADNRI